mgnify:CR=1 FL=1
MAPYCVCEDFKNFESEIRISLTVTNKGNNIPKPEFKELLNKYVIKTKNQNNKKNKII